MNDEPLTVYSNTGCVQCTATLRALDNAGIPYRVINLTDDPVALQHVKESGFLQAPSAKPSRPLPTPSATTTRNSADLPATDQRYPAKHSNEAD